MHLMPLVSQFKNKLVMPGTLKDSKGKMTLKF